MPRCLLSMRRYPAALTVMPVFLYSPWLFSSIKSLGTGARPLLSENSDTLVLSRKNAIKRSWQPSLARGCQRAAFRVPYMSRVRSATGQKRPIGKKPGRAYCDLRFRATYAECRPPARPNHSGFGTRAMRPATTGVRSLPEMRSRRYQRAAMLTLYVESYTTGMMTAQPRFSRAADAR
jgi:hypothetical protein